MEHASAASVTFGSVSKVQSSIGQGEAWESKKSEEKKKKEKTAKSDWNNSLSTMKRSFKGNTFMTKAMRSEGKHNKAP